MDSQVVVRAPECAPVERLNAECQCTTLDRGRLQAELVGPHDEPARWGSLLEPRPHLFSNTAVFVSEADMAAMQATVAAIEAASALPAYRAAVAARAPAIAPADFGPRGAFMGYDFHIGEHGPQLIEVNTNAGGAFLNAALVGAHTSCCGQTVVQQSGGDFAARVVAMFRAEWARAGRTAPLARVAIVDDAPEQQYLFPEFLLAQRLLQDAGIAADIADAAELEARDGALWFDGGRVDLVYNRLVDFALDEPRHAALRGAYERGEVVLTPNPHLHALLADKRNLVFLSDAARLGEAGLAPAHVAALQRHLPRAVAVTAADADTLWTRRNALFFKPAAGHGSKAVYRGDKITRSAFAGVLAGDYVAQEFAAPGQRTIAVDGALTARKTDVRLYTYDGQVLLAAARLYQGQTTNFRTPGGGFAPLVVVADKH
ncbi:MAG: hypothetical protein RL477_590 [Pseudomonadota bacterium]